MASTYENVAYERVLKGVELILETEFGAEIDVYLSPEAIAMPGQSIRLWSVDTEFVSRPAGGQTHNYSVEVVVTAKKGTSKRKTIDQENEIASRCIRVLSDNTAYKVSDVYKWHNGHSEDLADAEFEEIREGKRFVYTVTVTEVDL